MINYQHIDGDVTVTLIESPQGCYTVTLHEYLQGDIRVERPSTYERAMFEYLRFIANEAGCYGNSDVIEGLVVAPAGSNW